ncbi:MAG: alpha/beta hydrolase [Actinobacteria bacterium]|nr:alpha/beta hydrolase [Actinomycetota bacterium]
MTNIFDTITFLWSGTLRTASRHLSIVVLGGVLLGATACGSTSASGPAETAPATSAVGAPTTAAADPTSSTPPVPTTAAAVAAVPRPTATIDELIGAAGQRVHIRCTGQGATTVLLLAGFTGGAEGWAAVEPAVAARARVCSYERPGTGTSDPATETATFTTQATDLHELLNTVGEPGPYVVVGHSFGGAEAVMFASVFADEVIGLVLVDASPTTWPASLCEVTDDPSEGAAILQGVCETFAPTGNSERLDAAAAFSEARRITSLGSLPMSVITGTRRELPADLAASNVDRLNEAWAQGQQDWMALSTDARLVSIDDTGHHIEIDQPGVVIDEITRLLP